HLHIACERAAGVPSAAWSEAPGENITAAEMLETAELDMGFQAPFVIRFPRTLLDRSRDDQTEELTRIAEAWVASEEERFSRMQNLVKINPIFGPSGAFLLDPHLCFVIMPFQDDLNWLYDDIIKPSVEEAALVCRRADEIRGSRVIMHDIWKSLCEA